MIVRAKPAGTEPPTPQPEDFSEPRKGIVSGASVQKVRMEIERVARQERIAAINKRRVTKFSHSEHFKQRQPTTARKLWKPGIKPEEEED
jgi:hypothetical protein